MLKVTSGVLLTGLHTLSIYVCIKLRKPKPSSSSLLCKIDWPGSYFYFLLELAMLVCLMLNHSINLEYL